MQKKMKIEVYKLLGLELLQEFAGFTTGRECRMSLATAYKNMHSIIRTQMFKVKMRDIPLFVASQLVRQTQGTLWCMRSKRIDRGGKDFKATCNTLASDLRQAAQEEDYEWIAVTADTIDELFKEYDRYSPTDLICLLNAEALMNMSHKRLCAKASTETRMVVQHIRAEVEKVDPDLAAHMVPTCIFRGGICPEQKPCGIHKNEKFLNSYRILFA